MIQPGGLKAVSNGIVGLKMAVYQDLEKRCPSLPPAFDMYQIVFLVYLINVPVHT
jgi:hypothetical protein